MDVSGSFHTIITISSHSSVLLFSGMDIHLRLHSSSPYSLECLELIDFTWGTQPLVSLKCALWDACLQVNIKYCVIFSNHYKYFFLLIPLGQIIDIILIATQTIGPSDGSHYVISFYGPKLYPILLDNDTYRLPQPDWQEL